MRNIFFILIFIFTSLFVYADQVVLQPDSTVGKDTLIFEGDPNTNYGSANFLGIGEQTENISFQTLIEFTELDGYIGNEVESSTLEFYNYYNSGLFTTIYVIRIASEWDESAVTWNDKPNWNNSVICYGQTVEENNWLSIDVTSIVETWINGSFTNYGFWLYILEPEVSGGQNVAWRSSDFSNENNRPKLTLNYHGSKIQSTSIGKIKALFD